LNGGLLLGVFTGNHAGAEALFEAGEYTIGSSPECEVALTDSTLAPRHCSFLLAEDGSVRLTPLGGPLTLAGESLAASSDWPPLTPALAGLVCLAWTRPGEGWAGLKPPSLLAAEQGRSREPEAKNENRAAPETADMARQAGKKFGALRRLVLPGVIILGLLGLIIDLSPSGGRNELKGLEQVLLAEGFSDLRVEEVDGRAMIYGLVPTEVDANKVHDLAARQPYPVQVIVRGREEFSRAILSVLAGYGLFPQVRFGNGEAVLAGYALDSLTENAALSWARGAAPRVAPIRSALFTRDGLEETLTAELDKSGLTGKVKVDWRPGVIALKGEAADKEALAGVIEAVRGAFGSPIAFQLAVGSEQEMIYVGKAAGQAGPEVRPSGAPEPGPGAGPFGEGFSLRGVTPVRPGAAGLPFITTSDGAVYFLGGALPGGYTLTGIYTDRLEFSKDGSNLAYKLQRTLK